MDSESATNYLYDIIKEGDVHRLKFVLREIQDDYENPCDDLLRNCRNVAELESYLKEYSYLFMVENGKVARSTDELESGKENADEFFEKTMKEYKKPMKIEELRKHLEYAPSDTKKFMETFYPNTEFKRYLQKRPLVFATFKGCNTVSLTERECVAYFQQAVKMAGEGLRFTSLRGHIGQAPDHVREYINAQYPDTDFRHFLENNTQTFVVNCNGSVYLTL